MGPLFGFLLSVWTIGGILVWAVNDKVDFKMSNNLLKLSVLAIIHGPLVVIFALYNLIVEWATSDD